MADISAWSKDHAVAGLKSLVNTTGDIALNASAWAVLIIAKGGTQSEVKAIMDGMATPNNRDDDAPKKLAGRDSYASIGFKFAKVAMTNDELVELEKSEDVGKAHAVVKDILMAHRKMHECKSWAEYLLVADHRVSDDTSKRKLTAKREKDKEAADKRAAKQAAEAEKKANPPTPLSAFEKASRLVEDMDADNFLQFAGWFAVYSERMSNAAQEANRQAA